MKRRVLLVLFLVVGVMLINGVFALEECFVSLDINEEKVGGGIVFSLNGLENLYGDFGGFTGEYDEEIGAEYVLNVYDSSNEIIKRYGLSSSRFTIVEFQGDVIEIGGEEFEIEGGGDLVESDKGIIRSYVEYDASISKITVDNGGVETDLGISSGDLSCTRTCLIEGESGLYSSGDECCSAFLPVPGEDGDSFVCTNCGDGVCSAGENSDYCWEDCAADFECLPGWIKTEFGCEEPAIDLGLKTGANQYYDLGGYFGIEKIVIESDYEQLIKVIRIYDPSASFGSMRSPESWVKVAENVELSPGVREVIDVSIRGGRVIRLVFDSEYANAGDVSFVGYVGGEIGLSPPVEEGNLVLGIVLLVVIVVLISWLLYSRDGRRKRK